MDLYDDLSDDDFPRRTWVRRKSKGQTVRYEDDYPGVGSSRFPQRQPYASGAMPAQPSTQLPYEDNPFRPHPASRPFDTGYAMPPNPALQPAVGFWQCQDCDGSYHRNDQRCPKTVRVSTIREPSTVDENASVTYSETTAEKNRAPTPAPPTIIQNFYNGRVVNVSDRGTQMGGEDPGPGRENAQSQTDGNARAKLPVSSSTNPFFKQQDRGA